MANGYYYNTIDISIDPAITKQSAIITAQTDLKLTTNSKDNNKAELIIFPKEEKFYLAYQVELFQEEPFIDWEYIVDAQNGKVLRAFSKTTSIYPMYTNVKEAVKNVPFVKPNELFVTGTGNVYPKHPNNSVVTTKNLPRLDGNGKLDGTHVRVKNSSAPDAYSATETFQYATSSTHFDEVNLYYHVDNFRQNYIEYLFGANTLFNFIEAFAHNNYTCYSGAYGACFSPNTKKIYFGDGLPFAKEDKVIYHEYSHRVVNDLESGITSNVNGEEGAISEGTPDYLAGSFTGRAKIGDYVAPSLARDMNNPFFNNYASFQSDNNDGTLVGSHTGGEFFSSILWDIRNNAGISVADADDLVLGALFRISGNPDFLEFRDAMIGADNSYNDGKHLGIIQNAFASKGVGSYCSYQVSIIGEQNINTPTTQIYTANPQCGDAPYQTYTWYRKLQGSSSWTNIGSSSSPTKSIYFANPSTDMQLKVLVEDASLDFASDIISLNMFNSGGGGGFKIVSGEALPETFSLSNNYPNPFNPSTQITFELPESAEVSLKVYNVMGQEVATLVNNQMKAGFHNTTFKADNLASGLYIARLTAVGSSGEQFMREIKMQLIK